MKAAGHTVHGIPLRVEADGLCSVAGGTVTRSLRNKSIPLDGKKIGKSPKWWAYLDSSSKGLKKSRKKFILCRDTGKWPGCLDNANNIVEIQYLLEEWNSLRYACSEGTHELV